MNGAVCPACGVAVVPGYVRCPKCRKPLPQLRRTAVEGGTAVEQPGSKLPALLALLAAIVVIGGVIAFFVLKKDEKPAATAAPVEQPVEGPAPEAQAPVAAEPTAAPQNAPTGPNPTDVASTLERMLKKQRLWATVSVTGSRADVRSMSCNDPAMKPYLDEVAPAFKAAGLTKLRCVEDSGRVVVDRDL
jgi:hypothetical protein